MNFSEAPLIHVIEDLSDSSAEDDDENRAGSRPGEAPTLFSPLTSAASKGRSPVLLPYFLSVLNFNALMIIIMHHN